LTSSRPVGVTKGDPSGPDTPPPDVAEGKFTCNELSDDLELFPPCPIPSVGVGGIIKGVSTTSAAISGASVSVPVPVFAS
jgi:threonine dehydratase